MRATSFLLLVLTGCLLGFTQGGAPDPAAVVQKLLGQWKLTFIEKGDTRQDVTSSGYLWEFLPDNRIKHKSGDSPENTLRYTIGRDTLWDFVSAAPPSTTTPKDTVKLIPVVVGVYSTVVTEDGRKYFIKKVNKKQLVLVREDTKATTVFARVKN
jgi:hypothetical protein